MDWAEIRRTAKNAGWRGIAYDLSYRALNRVTLYMRLHGKTLTMDSMDHQFLAGPRRFQYGFLDEAALRRYSLDPSNHLSAAFLDQALRKGDSCYAVLDGEILASLAWYSNRPTRINKDLVLHFQSAWVYGYHSHTREEYRGQRLQAYRIAKAAEAMTQRGFKGMICYVEANNFSSLRSLDRVGYRDFGKVSVLRFLGRHIIRRDAACGGYGFDVKESPRDALDIVPTR